VSRQSVANYATRIGRQPEAHIGEDSARPQDGLQELKTSLLSLGKTEGLLDRLSTLPIRAPIAIPRSENQIRPSE